MADTRRTVSIYIDQTSADLALRNLQAQADRLTQRIDAGRAAGRNMAAAITQLEGTRSSIRAVQDQIDRGLRPTLMQQENLVNRLRNELRRMSEDAPGYAERFRAFQTANATLQTMQQRLAGVARESQSLLSRFKPAAIAVAIGNGISNLVSSAVSSVKEFISDIGTVTNKYEKLQALLSNTLGGKEAGADAFAMLTQFAAETPFQLDELTAAYLKLINRGIKPTKDELAAFGDIAASQGKSFDQFTEAILDATTGEFERLKEFGIKASQAGDEVTLAFGNITKTVPKSGEAIKNALIAIRNEAPGIAGSMKVIAGTTEGALSNMADGFDRLKNSIGERFSRAVKGGISIVGDLINSFNDLIKLPVTEKLEEERLELNGLVLSLTDASLSTAQRSQIITELNQKYPQFITNIDLEKASTQKLLGFLDAVNVSYRRKIELAAYGQIADKANENATNANQKLIESTKAYNAELVRLGFTQEQIAKGVTWEQLMNYDKGSAANALGYLTDLEDARKRLTEAQKEGLSAENDMTGARSRNAKEDEENLANYSNAIAKYQKLVNDKQQQLDKLGGVKGLADAANPVKVSLANEIAQFQGYVDKYTGLVQGLKNASTKVVDTPGTAGGAPKTEAQRKKELAEIKAHNKELNAEAQRQQAEEDQRLAAMNALTAKHRKLFEEQLKEYPELQAKLDQFFDTEYNVQLRKIQDFYDKKRQIFQNDATALKQIQQAEDAELQAYFNNQVAKAAASNGQGILGQIQQAREKEFRELAARDELALLGEHGQEKLALQLQQLEDERLQQLSNTQLTENERLLIYQQTEEKIAELRKQYELQRLEAVLDYAQQVQGILSSLNQVSSNKEDAALAKDKKANDQKRKNLEQQLKSKAISQQEYNRKIAALDAEDDARQEAIRKKQFDRQKRLELIQAGISGAQAILKATASYPWPANLVPIGFAVATTAAQIAAIASKKYARGGFLEGPSHAERGIAMINRQTGQEVGEAEGGEVMLSKKTVRNNWDVISPLLQSSLSGTGARVQFPWQSRSYQAINYSNATAAVRQVRKFENGGFIDAAGSGANAEAQEQSNAVNMAILDSLDALRRQMSKPSRSYVVLQDVNDSQATMDKIRNAATVTR